jgi:hypothetical protein
LDGSERDDPLLQPFIECEAATHERWLAEMNNLPPEQWPMSDEDVERVSEQFRDRLLSASEEIIRQHGYNALAHEAIAATRVPDLLTHRAAVVVERIARGAGMTYWYYCGDAADLDQIELLLHPGSQLIFMFDDRIKRTRYSAELRNALEGKPMYIGIPLANKVVLDMRDCDLDELDENELAYEAAREVFYGEFPMPLNDGDKQVELLLPDEDGIVRNHPH